MADDQAETAQRFIRVARLGDVPAGKAFPVDAEGKAILLCNSRDRIFAIVNECSHAQEKLECGRLRAGWIACPVHGARFDLETGEPLNPPANRPIQTFPVRIVEDWIEVGL